MYFDTIVPGGLRYKSEGDVRRLALECKLQILVSLRVFGMESHYICPFKFRLIMCIRKFTNNTLTQTTQKSPLGVSLSLGNTHIGLLYGLILNFPTSIPVSVIWESPRTQVLYSRPKKDGVIHLSIKSFVLI